MSKHITSCRCGKPGDKRCGRCKAIGYCSKECQVADFLNHKKICKMLAGNLLAATPEDTWTNIMSLSTRWMANPLPTATNCQRVPLEKMLPLFIASYIAEYPSTAMSMLSPVRFVSKS